ncbi:MAG: histidine kinase [Hydrogenophilaceae bacterium]|nr:histidine kinase [Hydrogenophilaceae bacterium]
MTSRTGAMESGAGAELAERRGDHTRHWLTHAGFWIIYLGFRHAAATFGAAPPPAELADFPFFANRALVAACYAAATGALLALFLWRRSARLGMWRYAILFGGAIALVPALHAMEEFAPRLFAPELDSEPGSIFAYAFSFGWALLLWATVQALMDYHHRIVAQARLINRAQALAFDAQLKMLHYQINPHFLFNTLNAISTLVLERKAELAERMLMQLSGFLRYTLDRDPNELALLSDELAAQQKYLEIEQTRFGDKLAVSFEATPEARRARLPSLILQPILENAVKHAITPLADGGRIEVSAWRDGEYLRVRIEDNGPGLAPQIAGERRGMGLANARERLSVIYGRRAGLIASNRPQGGCSIELWLPFEQEAILEPTSASFAGR